MINCMNVYTQLSNHKAIGVCRRGVGNCHTPQMLRVRQNPKNKRKTQKAEEEEEEEEEGEEDTKEEAKESSNRKEISRLSEKKEIKIE